jgi:single-stranded-DNA-specific exonuclease
MNEKRWIEASIPDRQLTKRLAHELNIGSDLTSILINRGFTTFDEVKHFFRPTLDNLHDPFLMKDMEKAVARISQARAANESVMIYGDYDVDGTSAVALVYSFLKPFFTHIHFYIPDRYTEGYGISFLGIDEAERLGCKLIIALDCGIKANDKTQYAFEKNIDFIICDHHLPGSELPIASAILNPKQDGCNYPFKELPGCGIGFKLCQALATHWEAPMEQIFAFIDLVAMAISADLVPIVGENRVLTYLGLQKLKSNPNPGFKALLEFYYEKPFYEVSDLVFSVGPRINAAGRMAHGKESVQLMIAANEVEAREIAKSINSRNDDRREVDQHITAEAFEMIRNEVGFETRKSNVVFSNHWHKGVVGIVASRLIEKHFRPTVVLCESNGKATGSARSVPGFDLYSALEQCAHLLEQFGGHTHAAGMTMALDQVQPFKELFEKIVSERITDDQLIPTLSYDATIPLSRINAKFMNIIKQMAPFGPQNMNPIFRANNVWDKGYAKLAGEHHLQLWLVDEEGARSMKAVAFNQGRHLDRIANGESFDICFQLEENHWEGKTNLQLNIKDLRFKN